MVACYIYISVILNKVIAICLKGCKQEDHCIQISELVESSKQSGITNTKWCMENHRYSVNYVRSKVIRFRRILTAARKGVTMHHAIVSYLYTSGNGPEHIRPGDRGLTEAPRQCWGEALHDHPGAMAEPGPPHCT